MSVNPTPACSCSVIYVDGIDMRGCPFHDTDCPWVHDICMGEGGRCLIYQDGEA